MNDDKRSLVQEDWPLLVWFAVVLAATAMLYPGLEDILPIRWGWSGEAESFATKLVAVSIAPAAAVASYLSYVAMMMIDPLRKNLEKFQEALKVFRWATPVFLMFLQMVLLFEWTSLVEFEILDAVFMATGVLFAVMGNFMTKLKPNYFVGIRVPWTLESEAVWRQTHRMAGPLWFMGGLSLLATPWLGPVAKLIYFGGIVGVLTVAPVFFAYVVYSRRETGDASRDVR